MIIRSVAVALSVVSGIAVASTPAWRDEIVATNPDVIKNSGYLEAHPDQMWRAEAVREMDEGDPAKAVVYLKRAARYADKPSQALLAVMLWEGEEGVPQDRPAGYAWMDLAAERGYPEYLVTREEYWEDMSPAERAMARKVGAPIYDQYADVVAKKRVDNAMRRAFRQITGSRTGHVANLTIVPMDIFGLEQVPGDIFYDQRHWNPKRYWKVQDQMWNPHAVGVAEVGPLRIGPDAVKP